MTKAVATSNAYSSDRTGAGFHGSHERHRCDHRNGPDDPGHDRVGLTTHEISPMGYRRH